MSYNIVAVPTFKKELKQLSKKHPSLKFDLEKLFETLATNPTQGVFLGNNCYKIRLAVSSKGKGKSGGARVITNVVVTESTVYLLSIYDKAEYDTLTENGLKELLNSIPK